MSKTKECPTCPAPLIQSRRSCIGCGMRPGWLHSNGLCADCQHPEHPRRPRDLDWSDVEADARRMEAEQEAAEYDKEYRAGWRASVRVGRTGQTSKAFDSGETSDAWDDGYHDHAAGRAKWHLRDCPDHDTCGE